MTKNNKGRERLLTGATPKTSDNHNPTGIDSLAGWIGCMIWRACYALEEHRQAYAERGHPLRQAGACVLLAMLRLAGSCQ